MKNNYSNMIEIFNQSSIKELDKFSKISNKSFIIDKSLNVLLGSDKRKPINETIQNLKENMNKINKELSYFKILREN